MNNCLILGSGRSGTSMVTGILAKAGYFMGDSLHPINETNPKGMFEDGLVNSLNEDILTTALPEINKSANSDMNHPKRGQRWLACLPLDTQLYVPAGLAPQIQGLLNRQPYCFKDPRFSYTLPLWRPYLNNCVFICVFREPSTTAKSILNQITKVPHLHGFAMNADEAVSVWTAVYRQVLSRHCREGQWLFVHYDQALTQEGIEKLGRFTGAPVDASFPDANLRRSFGDASTPMPSETEDIYRELCARAKYKP